MPCVVSYDLRSPGKEYNNLLYALKILGGVHILKSTWYFANLSNHEVLCDQLRSHIDGTDGIFVMSSTSPTWAAFGIDATPRAVCK